MKTSARISAVLLVILTAFQPALSQIYRWRDKDGNLVISNHPPPPGVTWERHKVQGSPQSPQPAVATTGNQVNQPSRQLRNYREIKVILYETDWCPYCRKAGDLLKSLGVNLVRHDIEKEPGTRQEKLRKVPGYTGVPLVDVEGIFIKGFGEEAIKEAVEQRRAG